MFPTLPALLLALSLAQVPSGGPAEPQRPVRDVTTAPSAEALDMSFSFQEPGLYHVMTPHFTSIDGEPTAGKRYGVEATMSGLRFVSSVRFEMIDEDGTLIGPIPMVVDDSWGFLRFVGMVTVPDRPFRVRTVGVSVGGKRFLGTYQKLFRPGPPRPPEAVQAPPDLPPEMAAIVPQLLEEGAKLLAEATAAREAQVKGLDGEVMTRVPRLRITNVSFAPYRSPTGRALGLQLSYDVEFDLAGRYAPGAHVEQVYKDDARWHQFRALRNSISPVPYLAHARAQPASFEDQRVAWVDFFYQQNTRYTVQTIFVPDFVDQGGLPPKLCLLGSRFSKDGELARMLAVRGSTAYRIRIGQDEFDGMIDAFDSEGVLYQNWLDEGTPPCRTYPGGN